VREALGRLGPRPGTLVDLASTFTLYGSGPADRRPYLGFLLLRLAGIDAAVFAGGFAAWVEEPSSPVVRIVSAAELAGLLAADNPGLARDNRSPRLALLDNRGDGAFVEGHLPGAAALPVWECEGRLEKVVARDWPDFDPASDPAAFYCYGRDCLRSRLCATLAARAGFRRLLWLRDGVPGWLGAGLPLYPAAAPAPPGDESPPAAPPAGSSGFPSCPSAARR
jgi:thiosulfate/3-mercaptopyruvate sulfurtransferase